MNPIEEARIVIEDVVAITPPSALADMLARAVLKHVSPEIAGAVFAEASTLTHHAARGDLPTRLRKEGM